MTANQKAVATHRMLMWKRDNRDPGAQRNGSMTFARRSYFIKAGRQWASIKEAVVKEVD